MLCVDQQAPWVNWGGSVVESPQGDTSQSSEAEGEQTLRARHGGATSSTMCTQKTCGHATHLVGHPWGETGDLACRSSTHTPRGGDSSGEIVAKFHVRSFNLMAGGAKRHQNKKKESATPTPGASTGATSSSQPQQQQQQQASQPPTAQAMPKRKHAASLDQVQAPQPQPAAAPRDLVRPDPLGPMFAQVLAFPPDGLARIIELTASYASDFPDRKAYEQLILNDPEDMDHFDFLKDGHLYNEYYLAVAAWTDLRKQRQAQAAAVPPQQTASHLAQPRPESQAAATPSGTTLQHPTQRTSVLQGPTRKAPPPPRNRASLEHAVSAVNKRRRMMAPQGKAGNGNTHAAVITPSSEGNTTRPLPQAQMAVRPLEKAMPRPKAVLRPAPADLWAPYPQPWTTDPRAEGGTLKLPTTFMPRLTRYAKQVVAPIAALLNIRVLSTGRRSGEQIVRVVYQREHPEHLPL
eukprot:6470426-Amphidinium_carterae.3